MSGSRAGALQRAQSIFDDGTFVARLRPLVAVPTESQATDSLPHLIRYRREAFGPLLAEPGPNRFACSGGCRSGAEDKGCGCHTRSPARSPTTRCGPPAGGHS
jgi:hypothetical protein